MFVWKSQDHTLILHHNLNLINKWIYLNVTDRLLCRHLKWSKWIGIKVIGYATVTIGTFVFLIFWSCTLIKKFVRGEVEFSDCQIYCIRLQMSPWWHIHDEVLETRLLEVIHTLPTALLSNHLGKTIQKKKKKTQLLMYFMWRSMLISCWSDKL